MRVEEIGDTDSEQGGPSLRQALEEGYVVGSGADGGRCDDKVDCYRGGA